MQNYKNLIVWQKAHLLAKEIYRVSADFPLSEKYGLQSQIRRAAISIPTNFSEGSGRSSKKEKSRFYEISYSSANEFENLLLFSFEMDYMKGKDFYHLIKEVVDVKKMLSGLMKSLGTQVGFIE